MKLDDAAIHLEALRNPSRLKIYRALVRAGGAGLPVGRLQDKRKIAPSTLSYHVKTLVTAGLINQVQEATTLTCHDVMRELEAIPSRPRLGGQLVLLGAAQFSGHTGERCGI
jgi:DNA-binding transcriptional ArsR family regulator